MQATLDRMDAKTDPVIPSPVKAIPAAKLEALAEKARTMRGDDGKLSTEGLMLLRKIQFVKNASKG